MTANAKTYNLRHAKKKKTNSLKAQTFFIQQAAAQKKHDCIQIQHHTTFQ